MGQFSWLDCKTGEQIYCNAHSDVYVLIPLEFGGGHIKEECYDGYGVFGEQDVFDLVVDWNIKYIDVLYANKDTWRSFMEEPSLFSWNECKEDFERLKKGQVPVNAKRNLGIALACYDEDNVRLRYPIKITHDKNAVYEYCAPSMHDPEQGW